MITFITKDQVRSVISANKGLFSSEKDVLTTYRYPEYSYVGKGSIDNINYVVKNIRRQPIKGQIYDN